MLDKTASQADIAALMADIGRRARAAARPLSIARTEQKNAALEAMAEAISAHRKEILAANALDVEAALASDMAASFVDRLKLDDNRIDAIIDGIRAIAALPDPVATDSARDRFIYFQMTESGVGAGNRDIITDFTPGEDRIELSRFDADLTQGFRQHFTFVGEAGVLAAGELGYRHEDGNTIVMAEVTGDGIADFEIELTGLVALTESDFLI